MAYVVQELRKLDLSQPKRIVVSDWKKKRSLPANNQQHLWYGQIAKQRGDVTALDVKAECKDMFGLPILLNSDKHADKLEFLLHKLDYYKHSYENRLKLVHCLEVTSLFNTAEAKEYMDNMTFYWCEQGIPIKYKE